MLLLRYGLVERWSDRFAYWRGRWTLHIVIFSAP